MNKYISIAPMVDYSDRYFRMLMRIMSKRVKLYTPMLSTGAILRGTHREFLEYDARELPLVLQLGGKNPYDLAECARIGERLGFSEINLNLGCPSARSIDGEFGAVLMLDRPLLKKIALAIRACSTLALSIKCRLGVDAEKIGYGRYDCLEYFLDFVDFMQDLGIKTITVHARIAVLGGLNPKQNREIPPLHPEWVYAAKTRAPSMSIEYNGGCTDSDSLITHLAYCDGVMLGRMALHSPFFVACCDRVLDAYDVQQIKTNTPEISKRSKRSEETVEKKSGNVHAFLEAIKPTLRRRQVVEQYITYLDSCIKASHTALERSRIVRALRHVLHMYSGLPRAKAWRRMLTEAIHVLAKKETDCMICDYIDVPNIGEPNIDDPDSKDK